MQYAFRTKMIGANKDKHGTSYLRITVKSMDYDYIMKHGSPAYFKNMKITRDNNDTITVDAPKLAKGPTVRDYTSHYVAVPIKEIREHGLLPNEPVNVVVEW